MGRTQKFRGKRTHGHGKKAGRGGGKRGGRGLAGGHKHKIMFMNKYFPDHFGRHGFKRPQSVVSCNEAINIQVLLERIPEFIAAGAAVQSGKSVSVDLEKLGYDKLLAQGKANRPIMLKVPQASKSAIAKIEAAGGKVEMTNPPKVKPPKAEKPKAEEKQQKPQAQAEKPKPEAKAAKPKPAAKVEKPKAE
jgi:large subunit ribosomal protein L15